MDCDEMFSVVRRHGMCILQISYRNRECGRTNSLVVLLSGLKGYC